MPPDARDSAHRTESSIAFISALVGFGLAAVMIWETRDFALDDAWIHLAYAKSLRAGDGLSYNPGDLETGFSSPLWVLALGVWPIAGNPIIPVKLLGALLHAATSWMGALVTLELARRRTEPEHPVPLASLAMLGGVLVACSPTLLQAATSGMEVPLAAFVLLATVREVLRGRAIVAAAMGLLSTWARPELLGAVVAFGVVLGATQWRHRSENPRVRAAGWAVCGAVLGLALWVGYCLAVSGHPWPNAQYIKGTGGGWSGLAYLRDEVLVWQPWLLSLTGVALIAFALREETRAKQSGAWGLILAFVATSIAIAVSRPLHPGVLFFESRYFTPLAPLPLVVLPLGLTALRPEARRWIRVAAFGALLPIAGLTGLQIWQLRAQLVEHTEDTRVLHTAVSSWLTENLPPDAVIAVEGAGAHRFFTPRSVRIVDLVGLNHGAAAHAHTNREAKLCVFVREQPTHLVVPADWGRLFSPPFAVRQVASFDDPHYSQVRPPRRASVVVLEVGGVASEWTERCK
ncbi:MAG: hypothetical protein ACRBN8_00740 [Nannocystales bacterium]